MPLLRTSAAFAGAPVRERGQHGRAKAYAVLRSRASGAMAVRPRAPQPYTDRHRRSTGIMISVRPATRLPFCPNGGNAPPQRLGVANETHLLPLWSDDYGFGRAGR